MSTTVRQPKGIPVGGQFASAAHGEAGVTLRGGAPAIPELERYGSIPAPLEGQTLADGSPALATFEESYREFFRPLEEHEAEHGPFQPSSTVTEDGLLDLAGLKGVDLGRFKGANLERDEETGQTVIIVHTRNGGYNAYCYEDDCSGSCPGCIQTDVIPGLPTFIRAEHESGDTSNYFRATDPQAGEDLMAAEERRQALHHRLWMRNAIIEGKQPPWAILSPALDDGVRRAAQRKLAEARDVEARHRPKRDSAKGTLDAIQAGTEIPYFQNVPVLSENFSYNVAVKEHAANEADATEARSRADVLRAELNDPLPPAIRALATSECERLDADAVGFEKRAAAAREKMQRTGESIARRAAEIIRDAGAAEAASTAAARKLKDLDWSESWPGDHQQCPARQAD